MQQVLDILISKSTIWSAIIGFSLAFFFMRFIPNQRQRRILRITFWSLLIFGSFIIRWWTGEYIRILPFLGPICVVVLIALKDTNLQRAEIRLKEKQKKLTK